MVTFRVSRDEYDRVQRVCAQRGIRSVSTFARTAVEHMIDGISNGTYSEQVHELRHHVNLLKQRIEELAQVSQALRNH